MSDYSDDCISKHKEKECKIFDMSCAMFHTRIKGRIPGYDGCPYYKNKEMLAKEKAGGN